jgi:CBS domain-containing protein
MPDFGLVRGVADVKSHSAAHDGLTMRSAMQCDELMTTQVEILQTSQTVAEAARRMRDLNIGFLPICDEDEQVVGVLTDRDIAVRVVAEERPHDLTVEEVMTEGVITCRPDDDIEEAEELMRVHQKARLVCVDDAGHVVGVISLTDIAEHDDECRAGQVLTEVSSRGVQAH